MLTEEQYEQYKAVKRDPKMAEVFFAEPVLAEREAAPEADPQGLGDILSPILGGLGGGLVNGILAPFSGVLQNLNVPTPQPTGLKLIPGNAAANQFKYPGPTDVRGLCPTLNTLANHGFISRTGITTFAEASNACQIAYGFGYDLCTVLSALGVIAGGDLVSGKYSIGGADSRVPNTLGPSLGLDKHGTFEIDNSITRQDTFFGNQADFKLSRWNRLVDIASKYGGFFGEQTFIEEKGITYDESLATNPTFFAGAKWFVVAHAERAFVYRALPNGTFPDKADFQNIAPFFLNETFPPQWFRRASAYSVPNLVTDIAALYAGSPRPLGANEGLNNFVPLGQDITAMTPAQLGCFILQNIFDTIPGQVQPGLLANLGVYKAFATGAILPFFGSFNCPLDSYVVPSPSAGSSSAGSSGNSGPIIINGVYQ
ncbi:hypothetical protein K402DRAFT_362648 [Aulographum hederae CBS 113979]|uniref:Heme haloperoxidase family profile domain-containing protein n=1 Tax=Aulographum hederae CBS 113979 TaxID=1176131 RepID=A0A6G1GP72_9PEZI|nr:hypothetical protein K402DRAFT_362648 [Aulographum hederae CBS 113979]